MLKRLKKWAKHYFAFGMRLTGLEKSITFPIIDFDQSWLRPMTSRWLFWLMIMSGRIFTSIFITLVPLMIGYAFKAGSTSSFGFLILTWFLTFFLENFHLLVSINTGFLSED